MPHISANLPKRTEQQLLAFESGINRGGGSVILHGTNDHNRNTTMDRFCKNYLCMGIKGPDCPCPSCRMSKEDHPDIYEMEPSASGNLLVDTVRKALDFIEDMSTMTGYRCLLIRQADKLTPAAEGGLLKIMEQRLKGSVILLSCRDRKKLPPTVVSRCKMLFTGDSSKESYFRVLSENGHNVKKSEEFSRLSPFLSVDPIEDFKLVSDCQKEAPVIVEHALGGRPLKALSKFFVFAEKREGRELRVLAEVSCAFLTDIMKVKFKAPSKIAMPSFSNFYVGKSEKFEESHISMGINAFSRVVTSSDQQVRPMFVWALGALSLVARASSNKGG